MYQDLKVLIEDNYKLILATQEEVSKSFGWVTDEVTSNNIERLKAAKNIIEEKQTQLSRAYWAHMVLLDIAQKTVTWKNCLKHHGSHTWENVCRNATNIGYPFFIWNGRVYAVDLPMLCKPICLEDEVI